MIILLITIIVFIISILSIIIIFTIIYINTLFSKYFISNVTFHHQGFIGCTLKNANEIGIFRLFFLEIDK